MQLQTPASQEWKSLRFLGGHNLFADERLEIVMLSNSELHLDVFGWDENGRLKVIWSRLIQPGVNQKNKRLQIMPNPVQDVDGDGQLEIVVSIYDRASQIHWRTEVIDPQTGITRYNLADFVPST